MKLSTKDIKLTIYANTANAANGYGQKRRDLMAKTLIAGAQPFSKSICDITQSHRSMHFLNQKLVGVLNDYLFNSDNALFIEELFELDLPNIFAEFPLFEQRFGNITSHLGRGLSQNEIENGIPTGGFNPAAIEFENEVLAPFYQLQNDKQTFEPNLDDCEVYASRLQASLDNSLDLHDTSNIAVDLFVATVEQHMSIYNPTNVQLAIDAFKVAAQFYRTAILELEVFRANFGSTIYRSMTPHTKMTHYLRQAEMHAFLHSSNGFFDFDVYLKFFHSYLKRGHSLADPLFYSNLANEVLRPHQYAIEWALEQAEKEYNGEFDRDVWRDQLLVLTFMHEVPNPDGSRSID